MNTWLLALNTIDLNTIDLSAIRSAVPDDEDVVAGWVAFVVFIALIVAVVLLGISLSRRLKNAQRAADAGKYDPSDPKPQRRTIPQADAGEPDDG